MKNECYVANTNQTDYDRMLVLFSDKNNCLQQQLFMDYLANSQKLLVFKCARHDDKILIYFANDFDPYPISIFINETMKGIDLFLEQLQKENDEKDKQLKLK